MKPTPTPTGLSIAPGAPSLTHCHGGELPRPVRFKFRCSAFHWHYFDVVTPEETFEVRCQGDIEDCPVITPYWSGIITPEIQAAWTQHCQTKKLEYLAWRQRNAHLFN